MQEIYRTSQVFFSLLKLDLLLGVLLEVLASFYLFVEVTEYAVNATALGLTFLWAWLGFIGVRVLFASHLTHAGHRLCSKR